MVQWPFYLMMDYKEENVNMNFNVQEQGHSINEFIVLTFLVDYQ